VRRVNDAHRTGAELGLDHEAADLRAMANLG
jgi:hypothetical protein